GTIPIRRTRKDDILRASAIQQFGKKKQRSFPQPKSAKPLPDLISQSEHQVLPLPWY
ncbi:Neprosin activation peptide, partial [Sesbania bispinosa]